MVDLDSLFGEVAEAMEEAEAALSSKPPAEFKSIDELHGYLLEKNRAVCMKMFPTQRSLKRALEKKVEVWPGSSGKGKRDKYNNTVYARFYVHSEEAVAVILRTIELKTKELSRSKGEDMKALKMKYPNPLDVVQQRLNGMRFRVLKGDVIADLKGERKKAYSKISAAQDYLAECKEKYQSSALKKGASRLKYLEENYESMVSSMEDQDLLKDVGFSGKYSQLEYVAAEWKKMIEKVESA